VLLFISAEAAVGDRGDGYILAYDSEPEDLYDTAVALRSITDAVRTLQARNVLIFLDISRSLSIARKQSKANYTALNNEIRQLSNAKNICVFSANGPGETGVEDQRYRNGVFTYFLLSGLTVAADNSRDGVITLKSLVDYVQLNVAKATNNRQHPQFYGYLPPNFRLSDVGAELNK
jgi:uncharacterized caspase-like protein